MENTAIEIQNSFMDSIAHNCHFNQLFNHIPGISFFVKDTNGILIFANEQLLRTYNLREEHEIVGKTDFDLLPRQLAEKFRMDDLKIQESGQPYLNIVELFLNPQGIPGWFITNKIPLFSKNDVMIGIMGTILPYDEHVQIENPDIDIQDAMNYINEHFREKISVKKLAALSRVSVRQFERKFKQYFNTPPQQYIMKKRIYESCEMIRKGKLSFAEIALDLGFYDQSSYTSQFKKNMGMTPLQYKKQYL